MTDTGTQLILKAREYEDFESLKKYVKYASKSGKFDPATFQEFITNFNVTTTGTADEIELDDGIAITQIGKAELTLLLAGDADNATTNGKTYTLVYLDANGASHTAVGTGTATLNGTPVAFVPAVTDFYCAVSFTASAADANVNVYAATAGIAAIYATIATTATTATEANLQGVGSIYIRSHTNHNDADGAIVMAEYLTPWGTIKNAIATIDSTDGTTEIRFFEATAVGDTYTATTTTVKDFYRWRRLFTDTTPTSNCHEFLVTDAACGNVDGSSSDIYGIILEGKYEQIKPRYMVPADYSAWIVYVDVQAAKSADADSYTLEIQYTPKDASYSRLDVYEFEEMLTIQPCILLDPLSEIVFSVNDLATADNISGKIIIVEVANNS